MAVHGKKSRIWVETTPGGGTKPPTATPTGYTQVTTAHAFRNALSKDLADAAVFGDENHLSEAGLKGGTLSFSSRYTQAMMSVLMAAYNSDVPVSVAARPEGNTAGLFQYFANYHIESIDVGTSVGDLVSADVSVRRDGAVTYAAIGA